MKWRLADVTHPPGARRPLRLVRRLLIALVTLALLGVALFLHPVGDYHAESDFYGGYRTGALLMRHGAIDAARFGIVGPLYEALLALLGLWGGDLYTLAKLISVAAAGGALFAWSEMLAIGAGEAAGLWMVALLAANPTFARYGYSAATDMPALALSSLALMLLVRAAASRTPGAGVPTPAGAGAGTASAGEALRPPGSRMPRTVLAAGVLAALAALTRYSAALLFPTGVLVLALWPPAGVSRTRAALVFAGGFALLALPWVALSMLQGHLPGESLVRYFSFYAAAPGARSIQDLDPHQAGGLQGYRSLTYMIHDDARGLTAHSLRNIPAHLVLDARELLGWPVAALAVAGLAWLLIRRRARTLAPVWIMGALIALAFAPVFYSQRYVMPLIPIELSLAALALAAPLPWIALPIGLAVVALSARTSWLEQREVWRLLPVEVREAGRALAASAQPGDRVMSRKGHIGYYSGLEVVPFPRFNTLAELAQSARESHADYLYYSWYEAQLRPEFSWLLDTTAVVPGLERVCWTPRKRSAVYRMGPEFGRDPAWLSDPWLHRLHEARAMVDVLPESLTAPYRVALAVDALDRGAPQVALELIDQAAQRLPREAVVWQTRGRALLELERPGEAAEAFARAVELDPGDEESQRALARARSRARGDSVRSGGGPARR
jgi:tetratricopeptide (TPR) repeat protein